MVFFVVLTNGLDFRTRQAVQYWRSLKLDVKPWIYRAYSDSTGSLLLEIARFSVEDNPFEDAKSGYYILNTNYANDHSDQADMLLNKKAAAYFSPWKHKIEQLDKGDTVFLYQSGVGVVAFGKASGKVRKAAYHGEAKHADEEYYMSLDRFRVVDPPVPAAKVKEITEANYSFRGTMFSMDAAGGTALAHFLQNGTHSSDSD